MFSIAIFSHSVTNIFPFNILKKEWARHFDVPSQHPVYYSQDSLCSFRNFISFPYYFDYSLGIFRIKPLLSHVQNAQWLSHTLGKLRYPKISPP